MKKRIKIILKSDLCAGSGYAFKGVIDSDTCFTSEGVPYIPARRLKGCLREAANLIRIDSKVIEDLFGVSGSKKSGSLRIGNAYPENYEELKDELKQLIVNNFIKKRDVMDFYTSVRAQTKIDRKSGIADDSSLRYTRVINGVYGEDGERNERVFYSDVEFDEKDKDKVEQIVQSLRNIGLHRNRGLGSVRCSLIDECAELSLDVEGEKRYQ